MTNIFIGLTSGIYLGRKIDGKKISTDGMDVSFYRWIYFSTVKSFYLQTSPNHVESWGSLNPGASAMTNIFIGLTSGIYLGRKIDGKKISTDGMDVSFYRWIYFSTVKSFYLQANPISC